MSSTRAPSQNAPIKYPWWYGGVGGIVACVATHPLDLAKVRLQTAPLPKPTIFQMVTKILANESVSGLYSGLTASILRQCTYTMARFGFYEFVKNNFIPANQLTNTAILLPVSMLSGAIGGFVGNPADVVNIRMQNDTQLPVEQRRAYRNAFSGITRIIREENPKTLFTGLSPNLIRGCLMTASQAVTYDIGKEYMVTKLQMNPSHKKTHFGASLLASLVATTICSPADVIKTRIMNAHKNQESAVRGMVRAVQKEGVLFLFRGWLPSFVRLGPNTIIIFLTVEQLKKHNIGLRLNQQ
ncbi:mitochondrial dicarboxylate transporter [Zygosaccharomyces mellis]|uniref:Mitochondrial dicarboxylate transporter n=1 Tax=Zygosaccharomyces mellis TaxID=42258 RepID=A0A4C2E7I6_9SACH|nr:mitochondrial dicarboxylate transporter [Zygosaccharomyces mellis]